MVVLAQGQARDRRFPRLAISQDQQASRRHALGQDFDAQGAGGQRREPRVQRGEYVFTGYGINRLSTQVVGSDSVQCSAICL